MGEVLIMKKFFNKDNFVFSSLNQKQQRQSLVISGLLILFFIFSAFTFVNALYCFADCIGSIVCASVDVMIKDLLRSLPVILSFMMSLWAMMLLHAIYRNASDERLHKSIFKDSIVLLSMGGFNVLYILIGRIDGQYLSLVEGSPSPIYPLDALLYSLLFIGLGVVGILYLKKWEPKLPYIVPSRGPLSKVRGLYCTFMAFWMLVALFSFAQFLFGLFIMDFAHGYVLYSIALLVVFLVNALFIGVWEFYYNELKEEKKKEFLLPLSIAGCALSLLVLILYFVGLGLNLDGPSNVGFGVLPVAFAASVNIATLIVVFTPLIVSITALIKALLGRKK